VPSCLASVWNETFIIPRAGPSVRSRFKRKSQSSENEKPKKSSSYLILTMNHFRVSAVLRRNVFACQITAIKASLLHYRLWRISVVPTLAVPCLQVHATVLVFDRDPLAEVGRRSACPTNTMTNLRLTCLMSSGSTHLWDTGGSNSTSPIPRQQLRLSIAS
jgi:hypothetical protein